MQKTALLLMMIALVASACSSFKRSVSNQSSGESSTYGYTEENAIKVGGLREGPTLQRRYLNSLTGPNGEKVSFNRMGSCCPFLTPNALFGNSGLLDRYAVTYEGKKDTVTLYLNIYDQAPLETPVGFKRVDP